MAVTCSLFGPLRERVGEKNVDVSIDSPATVRRVLDRLVEEHPPLEGTIFDDDGALQSINVTIDGANIHQADGLDTEVEAGATVRLAPPITGGGPLFRHGTER